MESTNDRLSPLSFHFQRVPKYFDDPIQEIFLEEIIEDVYYMTKEQYATNVVQVSYSL